MPTYRVYYAEREPSRQDTIESRIGRSYPQRSEPYKETEWEEEVEAPDLPGALDAFFKDHVRDDSRLMWVDEDGESHPVEGLEGAGPGRTEWDPAKTYIWVEDSPEHGRRMMEYQGIDEATPGMVTCPLCDGRGEVDEEVADEFLETWGEEDGASNSG